MYQNYGIEDKNVFCMNIIDASFVVYIVYGKYDPTLVFKIFTVMNLL